MNLCYLVQKLLWFLTIEVILTSVQKQMAEAARFGRFQSRIVGGENVTPVNKYPMVVALQNSIGALDCSGTIYNKHIILTSAYCAKNADPQNQTYYVIAGIYNLGEPDPRYTQNMSIKTVTYHEKYQGEPGIPDANNIGVIRLKRPLKWNDHVAPTNLPPVSWDVPMNKKIEGLTTGWGAGATGAPPYFPSQPLQELRRNLVTTAMCQKLWPVTDDHVCIEKLDQGGTCFNDYGGPLFFYNKNRNTYIQIGITSVVPSDCPKNSGFVFTKISRYQTWIEQAVRICKKLRSK